MRLDVIPEGFLERAAVAVGLVPSPIVRVMWGVAITRIVLPAMKLGFFEAIGEGEKTPEEVAMATGCDVEGTRVMLAALNGFDYLSRKGGRFSLRPATKKWILATAPSSMRAALEFAENLDEMMSGIETSVRTGQRGGLHEAPHPPEWWRRYMEGLGALSKHTGTEVARRVKIQAPQRLLDVGGGHGMYAVAFCKRHLALQATVLDLPDAARVGRDMVARVGMSDRVHYLEGDLRTTPWGEGYDVILLFNILHNLVETDARQALERAHRSLNAGGTLLILDGDHAGHDGDLNSAEGFGELFFFSVSASSTWPEKTLRGWLDDVGFLRTRRKHLFTFPSTILLVARK